MKDRENKSKKEWEREFLSYSMMDLYQRWKPFYRPHISLPLIPLFTDINEKLIMLFNKGVLSGDIHISFTTLPIGCPSH